MVLPSPVGESVAANLIPVMPRRFYQRRGILRLTPPDKTTAFANRFTYIALLCKIHSCASWPLDPEWALIRGLEVICTTKWKEVVTSS